MIWFEADKGGAGGSANGDGSEGQKDQGLVFGNWLKGQPEEIRTMLDDHTKGIKTALDSERGNRKELEKQLRDLAGKAEKGSQAEQELTGAADKIAEADRKADFYEAAHAAGVRNLKLAYTVAVSDEMFDRRGGVNFELLKQHYPELFGTTQKAPAGNAGSGTGGSQATGATMNDWIRHKAGRG